MAISFNTGTTVDDANTATTTKAVTIPAGVKAGDVILAVVTGWSSTNTAETIQASSTGTTPRITVPTQGFFFTTDNIQGAVFSVAATATDAGKVITFSFVSGDTAKWSIALGAWTGAYNTSPADASASTTSSGVNASLTCPTVPVSFAGDWCVELGSLATAAGTYTGPGAGFTSRESHQNASSGGGAFIWDSNGTTASPAGGAVFTSTSGDNWWVGFTVALAAMPAPSETVQFPAGGIGPLRRLFGPVAPFRLPSSDGTPSTLVTAQAATGTAAAQNATAPLAFIATAQAATGTGAALNAPAGPQPVGAPTGGPWVLSFHDEFDTPYFGYGTQGAPNPAVWMDHMMEGDDQRNNENTETAWYSHNKAGLMVSGSVLSVHARFEDPTSSASVGYDPLCPATLNNSQTPHFTSSIAISRPGFSATYGYWEAYAKVPDDGSAPNAWPAIWAICPDGNWPPEIDLEEWFSANGHGGYFDLSGSKVLSVTYTGDGGWHTWGLRYSPSDITLFKDGTSWGTYTTGGDITNLPLSWILQLTTQFSTGTGFPCDTQVDYVRHWTVQGVPAQPAVTSVSPADGVPTAGTVAVSFAAVPGATSYRVTAAPIDGHADSVTFSYTGSHPGPFTGSSSPVSATGLTNGARYSFTVAAINATGYSIESLPFPGMPQVITAGPATGTGAALDATVSTSSGTTVTAVVATGTGAAQPATISVAVTAAVATGTGTAQAATANVAVTATLATGTGTAQAPTVNVAARAAVATGTGTAQGAAAAVAVTPAVATGTGAAQSATAAVAVTAQVATGTGAAQNATVQTSGSTTATAQVATGTGTAQPATVNIALPAAAATGTGTAQNATAAVAVTATQAAGTAAAQPATAATAATVTAQAATGTGAALDATVQAGATANAHAQVATGTGTATAASLAIAANAQAATALAAALQTVPFLVAATGSATVTDPRDGTPSVTPGATSTSSVS